MNVFIFLLCLNAFGEGAKKPNIVIITVDTLRADRLGAYGYERDTSPHIDDLLKQGVVFTRARTPEPLTAPALTSLFTSLYPHQHGASRNGLRQREGLASFPKLLADQGYQTAAMISNWTLKHRLSGMGEHFKTYVEVMERKRWWGLFLSESNATDISDRGIAWLAQQKSPFCLWLHYADPHAPYRLHREYNARLGIEGEADKSDKYDSEIAFTDDQIGRVLKVIPPDTLIVFASDHGESLGEHDYWGHGRHLYEQTLHIPMAIVWPKQLTQRKIEAPAILLDIAPTLLSLLDLPVPASFRGFDWTPVLKGKAMPNPSRVTWYQTHKGAVQTKAGAKAGREKGLLEIALLQKGKKEVFRIRSRARKVFDLNGDPGEIASLVSKRSEISESLRRWALEVNRGLRDSKTPLTDLDENDVEMLRSLGYIE